ncbi:MAG: hypothetical protein KBA66_14715 [Leptospiraceae bacterium]|nr:hypothetical protein [Leptospiraceae bacterium]
MNILEMERPIETKKDFTYNRKLKIKVNLGNQKLIYLNSIILVILTSLFSSCLGFTEIDTSKSWCKEKLMRNDFSDGYSLFALPMCYVRKKKENESQESYDTYLASMSERCKDLPTFVILDLYLVKKKRDKCKNINSFEPTLHEGTAIIQPNNFYAK